MKETGDGRVTLKTALGRVLVGAVLAVWGIVFFILAIYFDKPLNPFDAGANAFPIPIAACLFFLAAGMTLMEFRRLHLPERIRIKRLGPILLSAGLMILYALAIPYAGFHLATLVFVPAMMLSAGERRWKWLIIITAILMLFNYIAFERLLGVPLPKIGAAFVD